MRSETLMLSAFVLAAMLSVPGARGQAPEPRQDQNAPATQNAPAPEPNTSPATQTNASPATQTNPAPEAQTQTSGEPKPGQGATPDQHPAPVPEVNSAAPQAPPPNVGATTAKRKTAHHKGGTGGKPRRRVVRDGGAEETEVQISEGMPHDVAQHQRASTNTLLTSTEANLQRISNRHLTADQQNTVTQIRLFMQQSRDAIQKSDVDRAHTLALKAHLLSDSLTKP